jgi:uncharacterized protein YoxC
MYLATSKDILYIVIAFAVLWLTIFLSWTLYYLIGILKDARDTVHGVKKAASAVESAMSHIKDKFGSILNIVSVIGEGVRMVMGKVADRALGNDDEDEAPKRHKKG